MLKNVVSCNSDFVTLSLLSYSALSTDVTEPA